LNVFDWQIYETFDLVKNKIANANTVQRFKMYNRFYDFFNKNTAWESV